MQALRNDPIASASWDGLELWGSNETTDDNPKPPPPGVTRCYRLTIPFHEAREAVLATAAEHGWAEDPELRNAETSVASKRLADQIAYLFILSDPIGCEDYMGSELMIRTAYA